MFFLLFSLVFAEENISSPLELPATPSPSPEIVDQPTPENSSEIEIFNVTPSPSLIQPTSHPAEPSGHDDDDEETGEYTSRPQPTEEVIGRTIGGIQVTTMTYFSIIIIGGIVLLFLGWKMCYRSASAVGEIRDDIVLAENGISDPLNVDNIEINIEDLESDDEKEKKTENNQTQEQQNSGELPNPFSKPPSFV